ncbi:MAG: Dihydrolipoyllysine-residue acetyltransferase component of pyruvate dehydrogenase complex, partial [Actinomycetota bacterium]
ATIEVGKPVLEMTTETQVMSFDFDTPAPEVVSEPIANVNVAPIPPVAAPPVISSVSIPNEKIKAVPKARILADEKGISLSSIHPTGPDRTVMYSDVTNAQADPKILERQAANRDLIARGIEMTRAIPQASFTRAVTASAGTSYEWQAKLLTAWAKTLRGFGYADNGVALIIESKYGSALPVFKNPDQIQDLANLIETTTDQARNGKVPLAMLSGATTTVFDLTHYKMAADQPLLFPNQATGLTVGIDAQGSLSLSLTIDLRALDFYDGANLLDRLTAAL